MTTPARRRTRIAGTALVALTGGLALQPMLAGPAQAGINCDGPQLPLIGGLIEDCVAPEAKITAKPNPDAGREASFAVTTAQPDPDDPHVVFECKLDRGYPSFTTPVQGWTDCSVTDEPNRTPSLGRVTYTDLVPDDYRFSVRASDVPNPLVPGDSANVQAEPTTYEWTVLEAAVDNGQAPRTRITDAPNRWNLARYASVAFATDKDIETYACSLQRNRAEPEPQDCGHGYATLYGMGAGDWQFAVSGTDHTGEQDMVPATARWSVPQGVQSMRTMKKGWKKKAGREYFLRNYAIATKRGTTFYKGIKGQRISSMVLVVTKCDGCGKIKVTRNDKKLKTIKLNSARTKHSKVVKVGSWAKPKKGRFKFEVVSKGKDVIVEGLGVSAWR